MLFALAGFIVEKNYDYQVKTSCICPKGLLSFRGWAWLGDRHDRDQRICDGDNRLRV